MDSNQSSMAGTRGRLASLIFLCCLLACKVPDDKIWPRNQSLPLFNPHVPDFICEIEANKVPPIDAQAEDWFLEARALEDPEIFVEDRDYKKIVALTRQAAERLHWKAMLNLASLYVEGRDPLHGEEEAVQLVEKAMLLSIPAAYDRMGTYYANSTGVNGDITRAYAFWQKAAQMGNPQALGFLGEKLTAGKDYPGAEMWGNIPVAIKMMECALVQGYGPSAYDLSYLYVVLRTPDGTSDGERTTETKERALQVLHTGVKLGCEKCANKLTIEFGDPFDLANMLVPYIDKARAERYGVLSLALGFNPNRRFPNLDKILPLPPADLPPWDGQRKSLLDAAMGVRPPPAIPHASAASLLQEPYFLAADYALRPTGLHSDAPTAPFSAYWQPAGLRSRHRPHCSRATVCSIGCATYNSSTTHRYFFDRPPCPRLPICRRIGTRLKRPMTLKQPGSGWPAPRWRCLARPLSRIRHFQPLPSMPYRFHPFP